MAKDFGLTWVYEDLERDFSFYTKRMFGGLAVYCHFKMVMLLVEDPDTKEYRGKKYKIDLWNGILFPTEREYHESLVNDYKELISHPVLGKWLYLEMSTPDFEKIALELAERIKINDKRLGIFPKEKKKKKKKKKKATKKKATKKKKKKTTKKSTKKVTKKKITKKKVTKKRK